MTSTEKQDVYTRVTNRILADLEKGVRPWMKPWSGENVAASIIRPLRHNGLPYRGINILMLWGAAIERGYSNSTWMSYRQAQELGGQVRKGEKGSLVVYANTITKTEESEDGQEEERSIPYMKGYTVFNVQQIDGLPAPIHDQARADERTGSPAR
jgi:antirestriction protein ArdC